MVRRLFCDREEVEHCVGELVQHGDLPFDERERVLLASVDTRRLDYLTRSGISPMATAGLWTATGNRPH
jgi:hypothetical protein